MLLDHQKSNMPANHPKKEGHSLTGDASVVNHEKLEGIDTSSYKYFNQFPLQKATLSALKSNGFTKLTEVQRLTMKPILLGKDVVAEAATGSGKTLAFLVPLLDRLLTNRITTFDGPAAIILTPTRELARQISIVLKRLLPFYKFTMLNIMGGKTSLLKRHEWNSVSRANILIGTPGRLAQHQTQNPLLDLSNLQTLVLDEADRLLDPTFRGDVDTIVNNLTPDRQTLLFSATQNSTIAQLTRLCMRNPVMVSTRSAPSVASIPEQLHQSYAIVPLEQKLDVLWTFLQSHCKKKILVFFSTQKQVRFTYELFQQLRPYFKVLQLRGNMQQFKRFQVYDSFISTPHGCVLLATNLAERGLDFPAVDWVVQYDCPSQTEDYIHRAGRTARFGRSGRSITFLLPSELALVQLLEQKGMKLRLQKFPDNQIKRIVSSRGASILAAKPDLAAAARSAFAAYLRDYCLVAGSPATLSKDATTRIFDPSALPLQLFANSLGLPSVPELPKRFLQWINYTSASTNDITTETTAVSSEPLSWVQNSVADHDTDDFLVRKPEYLSQRSTNHSGTARNLLDVVDESESSENDNQGEQPPPLSEPLKRSKKRKTRARLVKKQLRLNLHPHGKIIFDETGEPVSETTTHDPNSGDSALHGPLDVVTERERLRTITDKEDRRLWKERRKEQNRLRRKKIKEARKKIQQLHQNQPETVPDESVSGDDEDDSPLEKVPRLCE